MVRSHSGATFMLHHSFDDQRILAVNGTSIRQFTSSVLFYISVLIVVVLTTSILVILGLSAVHPALNRTNIFHRPNLPMSSEPTNSSKNANVSEVQTPP
jgi:hypothetical protein